MIYPVQLCPGDRLVHPAGAQVRGLHRRVRHHQQERGRRPVRRDRQHAAETRQGQGQSSYIVISSGISSHV